MRENINNIWEQHRCYARKIAFHIPLKVCMNQKLSKKTIRNRKRRWSRNRWRARSIDHQLTSYEL